MLSTGLFGASQATFACPQRQKETVNLTTKGTTLVVRPSPRAAGRVKIKHRNIMRGELRFGRDPICHCNIIVKYVREIQRTRTGVEGQNDLSAGKSPGSEIESCPSGGVADICIGGLPGQLLEPAAAAPEK